MGFCYAEPHITRAYWKKALDFCHTSLTYVRRVLWASLAQNHMSMMFTGRELRHFSRAESCITHVYAQRDKNHISPM